LGWTTMDSVFLGGILSISSTTIIVRAFEELGVKAKKFAGLVVGILVVQDLVAILLLVLLSTLAVSRQFSGVEMLLSVGKLVFFLVLWFVTGIFFLPSLLRRARAFMTDEMLLVSAIALCLMMVVLATNVGFSPALGAFIMGSILAETTMGGKIEHLTLSVKNLFGAVFFVSVGMLIDPKVLLEYAGPIALISVITILGQSISNTAGALISGQPLKTSVQAGMSLSQIGEFSFIIATLGLTLNVTSNFLYPIAVAVSAITTFTTPYMIKASTPFYNWLSVKLPARFVQSIDRYSSSAGAIRSVSDWRLVLRANLVQAGIFSIVIIGVIMLMGRYTMAGMPGAAWSGIAAPLITLLIISPLLWALAVRNVKAELTARLKKNGRYRGPLFMMRSLRIALAVFFIGFLINNMLSLQVALIALAAFVLLMLLTYKRLQAIYDRIERRFMSNLNDKEKVELRESGVHLVPWDAHISSFTLSAGFTGIGKTLMELQLRETIGVNIAMIKRGTFTIQVPDRFEKIYPGDVLYVIGTDEQLEAFKKHMEQSSTVAVNYDSPEREVSLQQVEIAEGSELDGVSIKESAIRERTKGLIVGIERNGERILNPDSSVVLLAHDLLWIVGNQKRIKLLLKKGQLS
ncbi:MAG TPA: cation:proton antiporter, partial [Flavipsychrobacter sp.]|nr:cation:proton antiporter [Flavipsychrobacter sp.]